MNNNGAWAKDSQEELLLGALPRDLRANVLMQFKLPPRDSSMFKYDKFRKHFLDIYTTTTTDAIIVLDTEGACTVLGVPLDSILPRVMLPHMPVVVNLQVIPIKESPASVQATEENPLANAKNSIDTKMDNMMNTFKESTFMQSRANECRYCGYKTAWAYTIEADKSRPHTPMYFTPPELST
jgi:hypothetical protein